MVQPANIAERKMGLKGTVGEITKLSEFDVEWKIEKFFSYTANDDYYWSPRFKLFNYEWYLQIYPNGLKGCKDWISLFLLSYTELKRGTTFNFHLRRVDGGLEKFHSNESWLFDDYSRWGYDMFLKRSELDARKKELAPSDTLAIICTLKVHGGLDSVAKTDSMSVDFLGIFTSQRACDVTLHVRNEKFLVHKVILMARSPVFCSMFEAPMREKEDGAVHIEDCDPEAFKEFLVYLYSAKLEKLADCVYELYKIADKYNVPDLKSECLVAMMVSLSVENVTDCARLAITFSENALRMKVEKFFNKNYDAIFRTRKWETCMEIEPKLANGLLIKMAEYLESKN